MDICPIIIDYVMKISDDENILEYLDNMDPISIEEGMDYLDDDNFKYWKQEMMNTEEIKFKQ